MSSCLYIPSPSSQWKQVLTMNGDFFLNLQKGMRHNWWWFSAQSTSSPLWWWQCEGLLHVTHSILPPSCSDGTTSARGPKHTSIRWDKALQRLRAVRGDHGCTRQRSLITCQSMGRSYALNSDVKVGFKLSGEWNGTGFGNKLEIGSLRSLTC